MINEAERYAEEDHKRREQAEKLNAADALCYEAEKMLAEFGAKLTEDLRKRVDAALRVPGHGMPSEEKNGVPGDLFVLVRGAPDARFERVNAELWRTETIGVADAVLGTTLNVPMLDAHSVALTVPPGTQPGTVLRLRGKGLPAFGQRRRGDLLVRVNVHVPEHLSAEARTLYERLRVLGSAADLR